MTTIQPTLGNMARARARRTARVLPSARRLIGSLRDLGYGTPEAVADLVDNSLAAGAHNVDITIEFDGSDSWLRISDDGSGMNASTITEAMRYGTERSYEADDLGKFGLGLKTASMSQCRSLTVASRVSKTTARVEVRQLDLDYVEDYNTWDVLILGAGERPDHSVEPLRRHRGTVILWENLDRILTYSDPSGGWARRYLIDLAGRIEEHLSMVFHRFLAGEVPRKRLNITINGTRIDPWDPFARQEPATEALQETDFELNTPNGSGIVHLTPYVLPPKASFSSEGAWRRMSGPAQWNRQQGFYIYRANRLIQSGGWSQMRTADEHTKLARVALMFNPELDAAFGINVAKMRVTLPHELRMQIEDTVNRTVRRGRSVYDAKPDQPAKQKASSSKDSGRRSSSATNESSQRNGSAGEGGTASVALGAGARRAALEDAALTASERPALGRIVKALKTQAPEVASDLGW